MCGNVIWLTLGRVSACLNERIVATEQMIMIKIDLKNTECNTLSLLLMLGTRQLLIWNETSSSVKIELQKWFLPQIFYV